jgi:hypothetical protein
MCPDLNFHTNLALKGVTPLFRECCRRTRTTAGASMLGVAAIFIWAGVTAMLFVVAAANDQLHHMRW